jgi:hypothetical protein
VAVDKGFYPSELSPPLAACAWPRAGLPAPVARLRLGPWCRRFRPGPFSSGSLVVAAIGADLEAILEVILEVILDDDLDGDLVVVGTLGRSNW